MTLFGLGENEITPLLTALAGRDVDRDAQARMFARAAWTGVAEPGDRMAGLPRRCVCCSTSRRPSGS
jgi:DNA processing protein